MEKLPDVNVNMLSLLNFDLSTSHAFYPGSIKLFLMKTTQQNFPVILTEHLPSHDFDCELLHGPGLYSSD